SSPHEPHRREVVCAENGCVICADLRETFCHHLICLLSIDFHFDQQLRVERDSSFAEHIIVCFCSPLKCAPMRMGDMQNACVPVLQQMLHRERCALIVIG